MRKVCEIYLVSSASSDERGVELTFPVSQYEMMDAFEQIHTKSPGDVYWQVDEFYCFDYLAPHLDESMSIFEFNSLTEQLSKLDARQEIAMEGLLDTVRNGKDALYLHPVLFSGVMQEDHIPEVQQLLSNAATFRVLGTDLRRECLDLTDEEYRQRLEEQTEQIDNAILEACRTKRRNLFCTAPVAVRVGRQFAIRRLTDWEQSGPYIAEGYVGERIEQLIADGRLITAQTRYGQGLRTATEAELKMAENADPMQMHF